MRPVFIDDAGAVQIYRPNECTGVAARWCPIHGDCTNEGEAAENPYSDHCSDVNCPLHGGFHSIDHRARRHSRKYAEAQQ